MSAPDASWCLNKETISMGDFCRLIKEFEREARTDGITAADLANRKKNLVQELNNYISMKKDRSSDLDAKKELVAGSSSSVTAPKTINGDQRLHFMNLNSYCG